MKYTDVLVAGATVAQLFERSKDAEAAAARLRAAGFSDVRLSERSGETAEAHVPAQAGATEVDFATLLERAGFALDDAREITRRVAAGAVVLTLAAGSRAPVAVAVLRGETVDAMPLSAVDVAEVPAAAAQAEVMPGNLAVEPGDRVIPLRAERLDINKERSTSEARVRKEVVTEQRTVTVPVQREQLVIERDGQETVRIPLSEQP